MGFRFRKSIKIIPGLKLNISKSGFGISGGVRGARVGANSRGSYSSVGIPGTGLSMMNYSSKGSSSRKKSIRRVSEQTEYVEETDSPQQVKSRTIKTNIDWRIVLVVLSIWIFYLSPNFLGLLAGLGLFAFYHLYLKKLPKFIAKRRLANGRNAFAIGDYQRAADDLEFAYNASNNDKAIPFYIGFSNNQIGNYEKGIHFIKEYVDEFPEDIDALILLASIYKSAGKMDEALQILQSLPNEMSQDSYTLLMIAEIMSLKGSDSSAIEVLKKAPLSKRNLTPDLVEILYRLGLLYEKIGDKSRSKSSFSRVIAYDANYKDVASKIITNITEIGDNNTTK